MTGGRHSARPLVDLSKFPANHPDAQFLVQFLCQRYASPNGVKRLLEEAGVQHQAVAWERALIQVWPDILREAASEHRLRALVERVASEVHGRERSDFLKWILTQPVWKVHQAGNAYDVRFLLSEFRRPILDRKALREHLNDLASEDGASLLVVTGSRSSGRTFSFHIMKYISARLDLFDANLVDHDMWTDPPKPIELMRAITDVMGLEPPGDHDIEDEITRAKLLANSFVAAVSRGRRTRWLVIDSLDRPTVRADTEAMIQAIVEAVDRGVRKLRLVLLGYQGRLPLGVEPATLREEIPPVDRAMLEEFYVAAGNQNGIEVDPAAIGAALDANLEGFDPSAPYDLAELAPRVTATCRAIFQDVPT